MNRPLTAARLALSAVLLLVTSTVLAQEPQPKPPCIAPDEKIYQPGTDGVKPPQLRVRKPGPDEKNGPLPRAAFELVINKEGRICSITLLTGPDESKSRETAQFIAEHWSFQPATRKGEPVAVKMRVNFN